MDEDENIDKIVGLTFLAQYYDFIGEIIEAERARKERDHVMMVMINTRLPNSDEEIVQ